MIPTKLLVAQSTTTGPRLRSFLFGTAAFGIGLAMAFYLFPVAMLLDRWEWWGTDRGDNPVGLVGYLYLAEDAWRWPITQAHLLNPPQGINTFYNDLVPIGALAGKVVYELTGHLHLYFGHWMLFAYGMQAFLGYLIFRQIGLGRVLALLGATLIVLIPAFTARALLMHIGLIAHWVILLAILFYVRAVSVAGRRELYLCAIVIGSVLSINPYLHAMCAAVYVAGVAEAVRRKRIAWGNALATTLLLLATSVAWAVVLGIIGLGQSLPLEPGFGFYSMNLLSPVMPQVSSIPGFGGILNATGGQYEGFNYLGGGILLIGVIVLVFRTRSVAKIISSHPFLTIVLIGLTLYAASDKLYLGHWYLGDLRYRSLPGLRTLTSVLRSSGRFFWPVGYCATIALVALFVRRTPLSLAITVLIAAVLVQWSDIRPLLAFTQINWQANPELIDRKAFASAAQSYSEFTLYPPAACAASIADRDVILQLQLIAGRAKIPVNAAFTNRGLPVCSEAENRFAVDIAADSVTPNPLVISLKNALPGPPTWLLTPATDGFSCREAATVIVCSKSPSNPEFARLGEKIKLIPLPVGKELSVAKQGAGAPFLGIGWSLADEQARWASGPDTTITGKLDKPICNTLIFRALVSPFSFGNYIVASAKMTLNDKEAGEVIVKGIGPQVFQHEVSLGDRCVDLVKIGLHFSNLQSPQQLGMNADVRNVSWLFQWFSVAGKLEAPNPG